MTTLVGTGSVQPRYVEASDGTRLAVREGGKPDAPTIICVHGFPDDHSVWDVVTQDLQKAFHVVAFDVRGSGESGRPRRVSDYRLDQLANDIVQVADAVSPSRPVHVLGHDWGSVQGWHAATEPSYRDRISTFTSISGPCLDHIPWWVASRLRSGPSGWKDVGQQWKSPLYMGFFQLPWIAPLMCRLGVVDRVISWAARWETKTVGGPAPRHRARTNRDGLKIYTANLLPRLASPEQRHTDVPVQVLIPKRDIFITPASQSDIGRWVDHGEVHYVDGGHWVPFFNPAVISIAVRNFVQQHADNHGEPGNTTNGAGHEHSE